MCFVIVIVSVCAARDPSRIDALSFTLAAKDGSVRTDGEVGHAYRTENIVKAECEFAVFGD